MAQVLSHLGSQAEIFQLFFDAGLHGGDPPTGEAFQPIWAAWDAKSPEQQMADCFAANEKLVAFVEVLGEAELARFRLDMFGRQLDVAALLRMRLSEHAMHTWDVEVTFDADAAVAPEAVDLLIDGVGETVARAAKTPPEPFDVVIATTEPDRNFELHAADQVSLRQLDGTTADAARIELPAEAFLRLVYGRLDDTHPAHGPVRTQGADFARLTAIFEGF